MTPPDLPGFTFVQHLGSGGFADVLLYEQEWPRQRVAVKIVRPDINLTAREKELFRSEANAMARLADHPFIVQVLNAGETVDGRPYLVMRYCPPPDLGARVRTRPMDVVDAVSTGVKLASAVETAHRSGILHRDIKPSNVLVTTYSEPALTDFGIAGRMHEVDAEGEIRMSYPWAPPELIEGRSHGSVASDVYSLGATIWNLLVGRSPFVVPHGDNSDHALIARILHSNPPPTGRPDVPAALDQLLTRCLAKDPALRPATALEVARSLQRIESSLGVARTPVAVEDTRESSSSDGGRPDATRVKPIGVVHAQGATDTLEPLVTTTVPDAPDAGGGHRGLVIWSVLGVAVAVVLLLVLVLRGGGGDTPTADPSVAPTTPDAVLPDVLPKPTGFASRKVGHDGQIRITWRQPGQRSGDSWSWESTVSSAEGRTSTPALTLRPVDGRACIAVALVRGGDTSDQATYCAPR